MTAPPRTPVFLIWGAYVSMTGARVHPRGRVWLLAESPEQDSAMTLRIAWNNPATGRVEYEDLGAVATATVRSRRTAEFRLAGGGVLATAEHPCVCGAGSVGNAAPDPGRITLTYVNPYNRPGLSIS